MSLRHVSLAGSGYGPMGVEWSRSHFNIGSSGKSGFSTCRRPWRGVEGLLLEMSRHVARCWRTSRASAAFTGICEAVVLVCEVAA